MNDKVDKWLCENFKNDDGDVTIGNILLMCGILLFVVAIVGYFVCAIVFITGWIVHGFYVYGSSQITRDDLALIDGLIGAVTWCSIVIIVYVSDKVLSYKVTSCKRKIDK